MRTADQVVPGERALSAERAQTARAMTAESAQSPANATNDREPIQARMAVPFPEVATAPEWIMYMPAGDHPLHARKNGKPLRLTIQVNPEAAVTLQRTIDLFSQTRHRPFINYDHQGEAAAGWVQAFEWRDKPEPGVYCQVDWSEDGRKSIEGRSYRSFSPEFYESSGKPALVEGAPLCMGSLVNNPAFRDIKPIWSSHVESETQQKDNNMEVTQQELAALRSRNAELEGKVAELEGKVADEEREAAITAANTERDALKAELTQLKESVQARAKRDAESVVASAVARGIIPPKDEEAKKRWQDLILKDPANADLLNKQTPKAPVTAGRVTRSPVVVVKEDTNDILRGFIACSSPIERGRFYRAEIDPIYEKGEVIDFRRFPVEAANVLGEVVGNIISQRTLATLVSMRPMLRDVVMDFSQEQARKGQTVYTRAVGLPTVNDFGSAASETADVDYPVTLSNHKEVLYTFTAAEYLSTNRDLVGERALAMSTALGDHMVDAVAALITDAFTAEQTGAAGAKNFDSLVDAASGLNSAGAPTYNRACWINNAFAAALSKDEVMIEYLGNTIRDAYGHWENVKGFRNVWEFPALPANSINLIGFAFQQNALLLSTRLADNPERMVGAGYPGALTTIVDPVTGMALLSDRWVTTGTRAINTRLDVLYGCARGLVGAGFKFVTS